MAFDPLSFIIGQQTAKSGGGSGDYSDVHFVTFMSEDGSTELYKRAVVNEDDCADPVIRGLISEPTKESTAQYNYTLVGWSATPNGALDENILKAVTADKTVYANFAAVLRYYTVTYYDDDGTTVLKTESLAYGATPSYKPTKDGFDFVEWTPKEAVSGDMSYTAVWKTKAAFATASWAEISAITTAGTSADTFKVGDTKEEVLTFADGTTENIEFVIVKIRDDGTMILMLNHALATKQAMHSSFTNTMANYFNNDLGKYLDNTIAPALSEELKAVIRPVSDIINKNKNIRLLTKHNTIDSTTTGYQYETIPFLTSPTNCIRKLGKDGTTAVAYWLGSYTSASSRYYFDKIGTDGNVISVSSGAEAGMTGSNGVVFALDV